MNNFSVLLSVGIVSYFSSQIRAALALLVYLYAALVAPFCIYHLRRRDKDRLIGIKLLVNREDLPNGLE